MNQILLFIGLVIILCLTIKPVGKKLPFPTLLIFIALGMLLGVNGPAHIDFSDYALTETVCSTALLFIMFYGGFNTNIDRAKPVHGAISPLTCVHAGEFLRFMRIILQTLSSYVIRSCESMYATRSTQNSVYFGKQADTILLK